MTRRGKLVILTLGFLISGTQYAQAQAILFQDTFEGPSGPLNGTNGWKSYYCSDTWQRSNGRAAALTDDGCFCAPGGGSTCGFLVTTGQGGCGASDPIDNVLINGNPDWTDYEIQFGFQHSDNDTIGLAFRHVNSANMYLFFMTNGYAPTVNACQTEFVGSRLYKIVDSEATQIASSAKSYTVGAKQSVRIRAKGNAIDVFLDANGDGSYGEGEVLFSLSDNSNPLLNGRVGLYSFQSGLVDTSCDDKPCGFTDIVISEIADQPTDSDGDTVADAVDNCPQHPNVDQDDTDQDGTGDVCDETPFPDADGDGVADSQDNCPNESNPNQADFDLDNSGDVCDPDDDNDGVSDVDDDCPFVFNPEQGDLGPDCKKVEENDVTPPEDTTSTGDAGHTDDSSEPGTDEVGGTADIGAEKDSGSWEKDGFPTGDIGNDPADLAGGKPSGNVTSGVISAGGVSFDSGNEEDSGCKTTSPRFPRGWGGLVWGLGFLGLWMVRRLPGYRHLSR